MYIAGANTERKIRGAQQDGSESDQQISDQDEADRSEDQQQDDSLEEGTTVDDDDSNDRSLSHICSSVRGRGLPRGRVGDIANGSCNSGLFNGKA